MGVHATGRSPKENVSISMNSSAFRIFTRRLPAEWICPEDSKHSTWKHKQAEQQVPAGSYIGWSACRGVWPIGWISIFRWSDNSQISIRNCLASYCHPWVNTICFKLSSLGLPGWEKGVRQRAISALSELWFAGCCCCCSFWSSSGWPPSRRNRESWQLFLSFFSFGLSYTFPKNKVQFDPRSLKKPICS